VAAAVLLGAVLCCKEGLFVRYSRTAYVEYNASLVRGAVHVTYADRRPISALSRPPELGWRVKLDAAFGSPVVEWLPDWNFASGGLTPAWFVRVPLWTPLLLLAGPAAWMWWRHLSRPMHACAACGYDLRGSTGGVCPECGTGAPQA
jgi:hypothetical protein